jgi:hypothetical protein
MKKIVLSILYFLSIFVYGQDKLVPLQTFFKEKFIKYSGSSSVETFYPAYESQIHLSKLLRDTSLQFTNIAENLYKHNLIEIVKENGYLYINPYINISRGTDNLDTAFTLKLKKTPLFRNTRGVFVEGGLLDKVSFHFLFAENQARFQQYERDYFNKQGELYDFGVNYSIQNAVIPGGSRTKPFKVDAYDYAYSSGAINFSLHRKLNVELGNTKHFIGSGYRSLLLSDNSFYAPGIRVNWKINKRLNYQLLYRKQLNLYRKPTTWNVESPYESKVFALSYLTFKPKEYLSVSVFSAGNQLQGDSLVRHKISGIPLLPLPIFQNDVFIFSGSYLNGITGLNVDVALKSIRMYGQLVLDKYETRTLLAEQIGFYFFDAFGLTNTCLQLEWNNVPQNFYGSSNPKLSYSNFNLPSAHPKGNNFTELFVKLGYEYKRMYINSRTNFYFTQGGTLSEQYNSNSIFNSSTTQNMFTSGNSIAQNVELGFRFNKKYNGTFFVYYQGRASNFDKTKDAFQCYMFGIRTALSNEYFDF